jgi:hypothetical protein
MEGAQADVAGTDPLEREVLAREGDEVGGFTDPYNVLVEDAHRDPL